MCGITLDSVDKVRDKVITTFELDINISPSFLGPIDETDKAVVSKDYP